MQRSLRIILLGTLFSAYFLHLLAQIPFGLPYNHAYDEPAGFTAPLSMINAGSPRSSFYAYPPVSGYLLVPPTLMTFMLERLKGTVETFSEFHLRWGVWDLYPPSLLFYGRMFFALLASLALLVTYRVGKDLHSVEVGLIAALALATFSPYSREAIIAHPNGLLGVVCMLAFLGVVKFYNSPTEVAALVAGALCGLAFQTKYNVVPIFLPFALALLFQALPEDSRLRSAKLFAAAVIGSLLGVFIGNPYFLSEPRFLESAIRHKDMYLNFDGPRLFQPLWALMKSADAVFLVLALSSFALIPFSKDRRKLLLLSSFPVMFFLLTGVQRYPNALRAAGPLYPFLALMGATALVAWFRLGTTLVRKIVGRPLTDTHRAFSWIPIFIALVLLAPHYRGILAVIRERPLHLSYGSVERAYRQSISNDDARKDMSTWITRNIPAGRTIAVDHYLHFFDEDLLDRYPLVPFKHTQVSILDLAKRDPDYVLFGRYNLSSDLEYISLLTLVKSFPGNTRAVEEDSIRPNINLEARLFTFNRGRVVQAAEALPPPIGSDSLLPLDSFRAEFPFRTDFVNKKSFIVPPGRGAQRRLRLEQGRYGIEMLLYSFTRAGEPSPSLPVIRADIIHRRKPFPNSGFESGTLHGWTAKGSAFNQQPVFLIASPSATAYYIGTQNLLHSDDYLRGESLRENPNAKHTGSLTSPVFPLTGAAIEFYLIGEASSGANFVEIRIRDDTGWRSLQMVHPRLEGEPIQIDVEEFRSMDCQLVLHKQEDSAVIFDDVVLLDRVLLGARKVKDVEEIHRYADFEIRHGDEEIVLRVEHSRNKALRTNRIPVVKEIYLTRR